MIKLYKLPLNLKDNNRWVPQDIQMDEVLAEYPIIKTLQKEDYYFQKVGALEAKLKIFNQDDFLDFNYIVLENTKIKYFNKNKLYFFIDNEIDNLTFNDDNYEYKLFLDIFSIYGKEALNFLIGQNVKINRNHLDRFFNNDNEPVSSFEFAFPFSNQFSNENSELNPNNELNFKTDAIYTNLFLPDFVNEMSKIISTIINNFHKANLIGTPQQFLDGVSPYNSDPLNKKSSKELVVDYFNNDKVKKSSLYYQIEKVIYGYQNKVGEHPIFSFKVFIKKNYNKNFRPSNERENILWNNKEFDLGTPKGIIKKISPLKYFPDLNEIVKEYIEKNYDNSFLIKKLKFALPFHSSTISCQLAAASYFLNNKINLGDKFIDETSTRFYAFLVLPSAKLEFTYDDNWKNNYAYIPIFQKVLNDQSANKRNETIEHILNNISSNKSSVNFGSPSSTEKWSEIIEKQTFKNLLSKKASITSAANLILTTKPINLNFDLTKIGGANIFNNFFDYVKIKGTNEKLIVLNNTLINNTNLINIPIINKSIEISSQERNLPAYIDDKDFFNKNIEVVLKNSNYEKYYLIDLNNQNKIELDNFDIYNNVFLNIAEKFNVNGSEYNLKFDNGQNIISYENDNSLPFSIDSYEKYLALNANRLQARKDEIEINYNNSILSGGISGGLGIAGGLLSGAFGFAGGNPFAGTFGLLQGISSGGSLFTQINQAQSQAKIQRQKIQAELSDKSQEAPEIKNRTKNVNNFLSPLISNVKNGEYGFYTSQQNLLNIQMPNFIRTKLANFFNKFGYAIDSYVKIDKDYFKSRYLFNFIEIENISQYLNNSSLPLIVINELEKYFNEGVRIWHCRKSKKGIDHIENGYDDLSFKIHSNINFNKVNYEKWILEKKLIKSFKP